MSLKWVMCVWYTLCDMLKWWICKNHSLCIVILTCVAKMCLSDFVKFLIISQICKMQNSSWVTSTGLILVLVERWHWCPAAEPVKLLYSKLKWNFEKILKIAQKVGFTMDIRYFQTQVFWYICMSSSWVLIVKYVRKRYICTYSMSFSAFCRCSM